MSERTCLLCDEPIEDGAPFQTTTLVRADRTVSGEPVHWECQLREVLGGIGHHEDHAYWCCQMHDPDGGRTRHQSALEVAARWLSHNGMPNP